MGGDSDGFWPPQSRIVPIAQENLPGCQVTALAAGAYLRTLTRTVTEVGDGDGFFEGGEQVAITLTVRNSGVLANSGSAVATLASSSPG
jgi:hypothetical protein